MVSRCRKVRECGRLVDALGARLPSHACRGRLMEHRIIGDLRDLGALLVWQSSRCVTPQFNGGVGAVDPGLSPDGRYLYVNESQAEVGRRLRRQRRRQPDRAARLPHPPARRGHPGRHRGQLAGSLPGSRRWPVTGYPVTGHRLVTLVAGRSAQPPLPLAGNSQVRRRRVSAAD